MHMAANLKAATRPAGMNLPDLKNRNPITANKIPEITGERKG